MALATLAPWAGKQPGSVDSSQCGARCDDGRVLTAAAPRVCWAFAVVVTVMVGMRRAAMWWVWLCAVTVLLARGAAACRLGGRISGRMECGVAGSPYTVTQDVEVSRGASLVFRPGVTVMFDPGVGMTVRGTLEAEVRG